MTGFDIAVFLIVGIGAVTGFARGFVQERSRGDVGKSGGIGRKGQRAGEGVYALRGREQSERNPNAKGGV